ncbi:MAG: Hsp70 family protein, partial [Cyanobacteria bacterium P01_H01_bin.130]
IDADGILNVSARDKGTGKEQSISISNTGGLSKEEVDMMRREADFFAEEDQRRQAIVTLQNTADNLLGSYDTTLEENAALLDGPPREKLATYVAQVKQAMANDDIEVEDFQEAVDALQQGLLDIGRSVYGGQDEPKKAAVGNSPAVSSPPSPAPAPQPQPEPTEEQSLTQEMLEGLEDLIDSPTDGTMVADAAAMQATAKGVSPSDRPNTADPLGDLGDDLDLGLDLGEDLEFDSATVTADYEAIED